MTKKKGDQHVLSNLSWLAEQRAKQKQKELYHKNLWFSAIEKGHVREISSLLDSHNGKYEQFYLNITTKGARTGLVYALELGKIEIAEIITERSTKKQADFATQTWTRPLHIAAQKDLIGIVKILLEEKKIFHSPQDNYQKTPMHYAAERGNLQLIKLLEANKANPHVISRDGSTILHSATRNGSMPCVKYIVEELHITLNHKNVRGHTALYVSVILGDLDIFKYLITKCDDVNYHDLVSLAVIHNRLEFLHYLIQEIGMDLNHVDDNANSFLHTAVKDQARIDTLAYLLSMGINVSLKNSTDRTALDLITKHLDYFGTRQNMIKASMLVDKIIAHEKSDFSEAQTINFDTKTAALMLARFKKNILDHNMSASDFIEDVAFYETSFPKLLEPIVDYIKETMAQEINLLNILCEICFIVKDVYFIKIDDFLNKAISGEIIPAAEEEKVCHTAACYKEFSAKASDLFISFAMGPSILNALLLYKQYLPVVLNYIKDNIGAQELTILMQSNSDMAHLFNALEDYYDIIKDPMFVQKIIQIKQLAISDCFDELPIGVLDEYNDDTTTGEDKSVALELLGRALVTSLQLDD